MVGEGESDEPRIKESKRAVLHGNAIPDRLPRRLPRAKGTSTDNHVAARGRPDIAGSKELRGEYEDIVADTSLHQGADRSHQW